MAVFALIKFDHLVALLNFAEANSASFGKGLITFARADLWCES
jgi:hypothetical protein